MHGSRLGIFPCVLWMLSTYGCGDAAEFPELGVTQGAIIDGQRSARTDAERRRV